MKTFLSRKEGCFMYDYKSDLAPYMRSFLDYKKSMGHKIVDFLTTFREIDKLFTDKDVKISDLSQDIIEDWYNLNVNIKMITLYTKAVKLIQLCKYINRLGVSCFVPRLPRNRENGYLPYIFSHSEMKTFFKMIDSAAQDCRTCISVVFAIPTILRLLYATGMRVSEAIGLKNKDVDFDRRTITVLYTKTRRDRIIPINDSLYHVLRQYANARNRLPVKDVTAEDAPFFIDHKDTPYTKKRVYEWFRHTLECCGIPHGGRGYGPRLHDLRHTFAVHSLAQMVEKGMDIYCALPILSIYIGHTSVASTEKYVRLTQEIFPKIIGKFPEINLTINEYE